MGANVVAGVSGIAAAYFVKRFGAMQTMIATHLPSNILLLAVPFMPTSWTAVRRVIVSSVNGSVDIVDSIVLFGRILTYIVHFCRVFSFVVLQAGMLVLRFCISQMDVPARQTYVNMVVASDERAAAGGITNIVRSLGMSGVVL